MSNHTPRHATAQLALRTVTAVAATLILAVSLVLVALGLPQGLVAALQGQVRAIPTIEVLAAEPDRVAVCMGPALSFGSQGLTAIGYGASQETIVGDQVTTTPITDTTVTDGFALEQVITPAPPVILSQPVEAGVLAGTSAQTLNNLNVTGLAASECQVPQRELWLVGGDTTTGRQTALSLVNPSDVQALIDIEVWGSTGPIVAPLGRGILLAPYSQRVISLAGLAPNEVSPVVRVTSNSVGIAGFLHSTIVRGLVADGVSVSGSEPPPSSLRVITGAYTPPEEVLGPIRGKEGYRDVGAILRLLSPDGDAEASITVTVSGGEDSVLQVQLIAGETKDLLLDEFDTGDISVVIESENPVVAALRTSLGTDARTDTDWVGSAPEITGDTAFAVPGVGEARLSLVNRGNADITVTLDGRDVVVPAGNFVTRPVGVGSHTLSSLQPFFAAVSLRAETAIESFMVLPTPAPQGSVMVSVR